jgi:hypothetical protein
VPKVTPTGILVQAQGPRTNIHGDATSAKAQDRFVTTPSLAMRNRSCSSWWISCIIGLKVGILTSISNGIATSRVMQQSSIGKIFYATCVDYCVKNPSMIGGIGHVVEIGENAWAKRKYNQK